MAAANTKLIIEDDAGKQIVVPFMRDEITIGRKEGNTIRLTERNVSRFHAKLQRNNGHFFIEDLSSYNGVKLNGDKIKGQMQIQEGDLIEIGDYHLALQTEGRSETLPSRPATPQPTSSAAAAQLSSLDTGDEFAGDTVRVDSMPDVTQEAMVLPDPSAATTEGPALGSDEPTQRAGFLGDEDTEAMPLLDDTDVQEAPVASPPPVSMEDFEETIPHEALVAPAVRPPIKKVEPRLVDPPRSDPATRTDAPPSGPAAPGSLGALDELDEPTAAIQRSPGPQHVERPRLVALNTVFAGMVWPIDRGDAIIGRTDDNDLTIQHKSVSRNHAKVVKEGDRFRIFDLQSANGVLLNGEEIESAILKPGDVVELGRVRLRYVPAGEEFALSHDEIERARIADQNGDEFDDRGVFVTASSHRMEGTRRPPLLLGVMALTILVLLVVIIVLILSGDEEMDPTTDAPIELLPTEDGEENEAMAAAYKHLEDREYKEAIASAKKAQSEGVAEAEAVIKQAERELDAQRLVAQAADADKNERYDDAKALYERALKDYAETSAIDGAEDELALITERILFAQLDSAIAKSDVKAAKTLVAKAETDGADDETVSEYREQIRRMEAGEAIDPTPVRVKPKTRVTRPTNPTSSKTAKLSQGDLGKLEQEIKVAGFNNKHKNVIRAASRIPPNQRSAEVLAALLRSNADLGRCASARQHLNEYVRKAPASQHARAREMVRNCKPVK